MRCTGGWRATLHAAALGAQLAPEAGPQLAGGDGARPAKDADLLATWVQPQPNDPGWYWWDRGVSAQSGDCVPPLAQRWKMFDPAVRLSRRFLALLFAHAGAGQWTAHPELLLPTLCKARGLAAGNLADRCVGDPFRFGNAVSAAEWRALAASRPEQQALFHPVV